MPLALLNKSNGAQAISPYKLHSGSKSIFLLKKEMKIIPTAKRNVKLIPMAASDCNPTFYLKM